MDVHNASRFQKINKYISEYKYYDSLQHILSFAHRNFVSKNYAEAIDILYTYALIFVEKKEYILAGELMDEYAKMLKDGAIKQTPEIIENIITIFQSPLSSNDGPPDISNMDMDEHFVTMLLYTKFMKRAIAWSITSEFPYGNHILLKHIGLYYMSNKQYSKAQNYLVCSQDVESLFALLNEWNDSGYKNEVDFFYLRAVMMLLSCGDICNAKCLICLADYNVEDPKTPIPIQFAHLLSQICEPPNFKLFNDICETYAPLLNVDPMYKTLIKMIENTYFTPSCNWDVHEVPNINISRL